MAGFILSLPFLKSFEKFIFVKYNVLACVCAGKCLFAF